MKKLLLIAAVLLLFAEAACANWYSLDWQYRRPVTITGAGSALTDYQVKVTVSYDSDMLADFADIRFSASDGTTLLDHWRESYTASTSAIFWVEVPSIPTSGTTIYMYYGNAGASTVSNGTNTFNFFDDFDSLDTEVWYVITDSSYTVSDSVLQFTTGGIGLQSALSFNLNDGYITEARWQLDTNTETTYSGVLETSSSQFTAGSNANSDATILYMVTSAGSSNTVQTWIASGASASYDVESSEDVFTATLGTWYILGDETTSSTAAVWRNYSRIDAYTPTWSKNMRYISLGSFSGSNADIKNTSYDWVRIRKYLSSEPTSTVGNEETPPTNVITNAVIQNAVIN